MTLEEIKLRRLAGHHLLAPVDTGTAVRDLCGIQAQYLTHALHTLSLRCRPVDTADLVKTWAIRGTMHLICREELPLFLHRNRNHFLRAVDTLESDPHADRDTKLYYAGLILQAVATGENTRESLKALCRQEGMTEQQAQSLFDPWGGLIRALCEGGYLCHTVTQEKAYALCPSFTPMEEPNARLELARRYFSHYGPATVADAASFFGVTQKKVLSWLPQLPVEAVTAAGKTFYHIPGPDPERQLPHCLFLAGFDQLLLGYDKADSLFLDRAHMQTVFTRAGIVRPTILVDGNVAGTWNLKGRDLTIHPFRTLSEAPIRAVAEAQWPNLRRLEWK